MRASPVLVAFAAFCISAPIAAATIYTDRSDFEAALGASFTDTYEAALGYPLPISQLTDAEMTAVVGETGYTATGFPGINLIVNSGAVGSAYCAGCNGSFVLDFGATSFTVTGGVFGVGFDVFANSDGLYDALVTYGDGSTELFEVPGSNLVTPFLGITDARSIASISFGLGGDVSQTGLFVIDNLTIGSAVPEPASWGLMIAGFGLVGAAFRRRRMVLA